LRFKGMSYESKNYLCDISCVQLWKALAWFWCGNTQIEVVLSVWKGVPYAERLCQGYNLGKVEDEKHMLLACPNTQKVREHFCSALPLTHINTLAKFMQTTNTVILAKFVACCQRTICPPWSTFRLMDSLVPNGRKIINNTQYIDNSFLKKFNSTFLQVTELMLKLPRYYHIKYLAQFVHSGWIHKFCLFQQIALRKCLTCLW
jgi:hypothetical protein